ncbi:hypothetical protein D3C81_2249210 [compost metagenome]
MCYDTFSAIETVTSVCRSRLTGNIPQVEACLRFKCGQTCLKLTAGQLLKQFRLDLLVCSALQQRRRH